MSEQRNNANITGEPLSEDELIQLMGVDGDSISLVDIESAILWWDENASQEWVGALDAPEYEGDE